jgi:predicted double-glycine peptidase
MTMRNYYANSDTSWNGCGQAAVATLVDYWQRTDLYPHVTRGTSGLVDAIYAQHKTDTGGWLGCTPGHVQNIFKALGFATLRRCGEENAREDLKRSMQAGCPLVVVVDMGKLEGTWQTYHYLIVYGYDNDNVYVRNMIPEGKIDLPWRVFMDAWHCWSLNSTLNMIKSTSEFQYSGICAAPTSKQLPRLPKGSTEGLSSLEGDAESAFVDPEILKILDREVEELAAISTQLARQMDEASAEDSVAQEVADETSGAEDTATPEQSSDRMVAKSASSRASRKTSSPGKGQALPAGLDPLFAEAQSLGGLVRIGTTDLTRDRGQASTLLSKLDKEVLDQLVERLKDGIRESNFRREVWDNPLTRPEAASDLPVHFVLDIDTQVGWVDVDWQTCQLDSCIENQAGT